MGAVGVGGVERLRDDPAPEPELSRGKLVGWVVFVSLLAGLSYYARYALPESDTDNRELLYSYGTHSHRAHWITDTASHVVHMARAAR